MKEVSRRRGVPFRAALNDALREALLAAQSPPGWRSFRVEPRNMGIRPGLNYDNVSALLELAEGDDFR